MEVFSNCGLLAAARVWRPRPGASGLMIVCKATFALAPGKLALAARQEPVNESDVPWSDTVTSLYAPADIVPQKPRPDVVLIGNAYAPLGVPARKVVARLVVGDVDKSVEVWCDRVLRTDGSVADGGYFTTLPLLYERAAGGPATDNPVGLGPERDAYGSVALPNLTRPGARIAHDVPIEPTGFGPVGSRWPSRIGRMGPDADDFIPEAWHDKPLPPALDMAYFNVAPRDQQPSVLRDDERIVLENLHAEHAQLTMTLPGIRLLAKATGPGGEKTTPLSCDTLWIDTSRNVCCLTYRGQIALASPTEVGWVMVSIDSPGEGGLPFKRRETVPDAPNADGREREAPRAQTITFGVNAAGGPGLPARDPRGGLPFLGTPEPLRRAAPPPDRPTGLIDAVPFRRATVPPAPPSAPVFGAAPAPAPVLASVSAIVPAPGIVVAPALVPAPTFVPAPAPASSPWALAPSTPGPGTVAPVVAAPAPVPPPPGDFRSGGGALLASNAAAGVVEPRGAAPKVEPRPKVVPATPPRAATPKEAVEPLALDLIFFDPHSLPRMRRVAAWKKIVADLADKPLDADEDDPRAARESEVIEDRREVIELLVRAEASGAAAIDEAVTRAVRDDGRFLAPLLLVAGELATPFDEVETLKATITTVTPLTGNDENLRASIEIAKDFLKIPGSYSAPTVVEGLTTRIRDAFNSAKRAVAPGYLDTQTERALAEQRSYQHRNVLGGRRQRALLHFPQDTTPGPAPLVAYLPDAVASQLPLHTRFKARVIARVHLPLDPYEQGAALEVLALARLCPPLRREQNQNQK